MEKTTVTVEKKENGKVSPLGKRLREIRERIEKEPDFKPLSIEEVRKEVERRRTGNFDE